MVAFARTQHFSEEEYLELDNPWIYTATMGIEASLRLPQFEVDISLSDIYYRVTFPQPATEAEEQLNES